MNTANESNTIICASQHLSLKKDNNQFAVLDSFSFIIKKQNPRRSDGDFVFILQGILPMSKDIFTSFAEQIREQYQQSILE